MSEAAVLPKETARLRFENEVIEMKPGDLANIPAHKKHRVEWTTSADPPASVARGDQ